MMEYKMDKYYCPFCNGDAYRHTWGINPEIWNSMKKGHEEKHKGFTETTTVPKHISFGGGS